MRRAYRYPLHPTTAQAVVLESWLGYCCDLYNAGLEHRIGAWKRARVSVGYNAQSVELTALRAEDAEARAMPTEVQRSALRRLDRAFAAFFQRCEAGEKPGFPRFRSRQRYDSISFRFGRCGSTVINNRVRIPKLGMVRFHNYRPQEGKIEHVTVRRACGRWWVCFSCDLGDAPEKEPIVSTVGIDLGLTTFAVLSNGIEVENPHYFQRSEELLARRQRAVARKKRCSRSRDRARLLVAKAHERVRNQRLDFSRKLAVDLFGRYDLVAYEDLPIRNMLRNPTLAKSISDASWGVFIHALTCKAESAGKWAVAVDPRGTSQRCSGCGATVRKGLTERRHACVCGRSVSRDHNAALNILALGRSAAGLVSPEAQEKWALPQAQGRCGVWAGG